MGRPLNKKYFGNRDLGSTGTADDGLGGQSAASITVGTAGSYTAVQATALTTVFPTPALSVEGAVTATGTPIFKTLTGTTGGTQTRAYPATAGALSVGTNSSTSTYTATLRSAVLGSVAYASATTISFNTTTTAMISGTSIAISGTVTGSMTIGGVAIAAGQTYYAGAPTTATAATLYATYSDSVNATNPLTISNGTTTGATFTFGTTFSDVTAVTVVAGGSILQSAITAYAVASAVTVTTGAYGSGLTIAPASFGVLSETITNIGSGYLPATVGTAIITGSENTVAVTITATIANSILTVTATNGVITSGMIVTGGDVSVGAIIVNQLTGTAGSTGTYTLEKVGTGAAITGTSATTATSNFVVLKTTTDTQNGMAFTPATTVGGLTGGTTYYIVTNNNPTKIQVATTPANAAAGVIVSTTASSSQTVSAPFGQNTALVYGSGAAAATMNFTAATTVNPGAIQITAFIPGGKATRQNSDIVKQVGSHRYKVENQDGTGIITLTAGSITAGYGAMQAMDYTGSTYYVTKLTARKAVLTRKISAGAGFQFATGSQVPWTLGAAVTGYSVKIDNE